MRFFTSFAKSLYNLSWLREETKKPGQAWNYFFLLVFFVTGLTLMPVYVNFPDGVKNVKDLASEKIPNFTATLRSGELAVTELSQPYQLETNDFVLVVDTVSTGTIALKDYLKNDSMSGLLVTKDKWEILDKNNNNAQVQTWKDVPDGIFTKGQLLAAVNKFFTPFFIYLFGVLLFVLFFVGVTVSKLATIFIATVLINTIVIVKNKKGRFNSIFCTGLYAITLPAIINYFFRLGKVPTFGLQLGLLILWLGVIILSEKKKVKEK